MNQYSYDSDDYEQEEPNTAKRAALIGAAALMILLVAIAFVAFNLAGPPPASPLADATPSRPPTGTEPAPTVAALPVPQLVYLGTRKYRTDEGRFTAYEFAIANSADYPAELFSDDRDRRPCVVFRDAASEAEVGKSCGLETVGDLEAVEFSLRRRETPPAAVLVELLDPGSAQATRSAAVAISVTAEITPSAPATSGPAPTGNTGGWIGPGLVSTGRYGDLSLVVDGDGTAHAVIEVGQRIHYLMNAGTGWAEERLPTGPIIKRRSYATGYARPVITLADRGLRVDYVHYELCVGCIGNSEQPFSLTGQAGQWSTPRALTKAYELGPEWEVQELVDPEGKVHLTHWQSGWDGGDLSDCGLVDSTTVWYTTNASGAWTSEEVAPGGSNRLHIGADGRARVFLVERHWCEDEDADSSAQDMRYATARTATGSFELETVPSTVGMYFTALAVDASGRPHVILQRDAQKPGTYYQVRHTSGWAEPELILSNAYGLASQIDGHGALHLILVGDGSLWYATNRTGAFEVETVITSPKAQSGNVAAAVSVDGSGRPHILFRLGEGANAELHYAVGPPPGSTPTSTASPSAGGITASPSTPALASPQLVFSGQIPTDSAGVPTQTFFFSITNWLDYHHARPEAFSPAIGLPGCTEQNVTGTDTPSRAVLDFHDASTGQLIDTFCELLSAAQLERVWFELPRDQPPPQAVFVSLRDRSTGEIARSLSAELTDQWVPWLSPPPGSTPAPTSTASPGAGGMPAPVGALEIDW